MPNFPTFFIHFHQKLIKIGQIWSNFEVGFIFRIGRNWIDWAWSQNAKFSSIFHSFLQKRVKRKHLIWSGNSKRSRRWSWNKSRSNLRSFPTTCVLIYCHLRSQKSTRIDYWLLLLFIESNIDETGLKHHLDVLSTCSFIGWLPSLWLLRVDALNINRP